MSKFSLAEHIQKAQPPQARDIEMITREIQEAVRSAGENILTVGRGLIEAKSQLSHGDWLLWLEKEINFSEATAQNYMKLARRFSNPETFRDLGYSKALVLVSLPEHIMEEYIEVPHMINGEEKMVGDMSVRELKAAIKERDEALKAAELAKAEQTAAEQAREKLSADMALANERIAGLNAEVEAQSIRASEAQDAAARLEKELEELRSRPVEVAVQADEAAVEAARREAEAAMQAQLNKARKEREKAYDACHAAEESQKAAEAELDALRAKLAQAEKKAALTASEDLVLFRAMFDQAQEQINKMGGVLLKMRGRDPEKAQGMAKALTALAEKIQGVAAQ